MTIKPLKTAKKLPSAETSEQKKATPRPAKKIISLLRGFRDVMFEEAEYARMVRARSENILGDYGFKEIIAPILEATALFKRTIGEGSDIVSKEMFTFLDRGDESVTMRPEHTAGIARAYIEHGMANRPQPIKLYSNGPVFRYDRPQAGRFRQFNQLSIEMIGNESPIADAEVIYVSYLICQALGLNVQFQINSLGNLEARKEYTQILKEHYRSRRRLLCEDCKKRLLKNPLRLLDCKEEGCRAMVSEAPQIVDHLDEASQRHFVSVLEHLGEEEVPYELNPYLVRGLDYYNRTAFEIVALPPATTAEGAAPVEVSTLAIGGGGRYDGLIEQIGGRPTPAVGMAFGIERLIDAMKTAGVSPVDDDANPDVFFAQLGEEAAKHSFALFERLRKAGIRVRANFAKEGLKPQLELADKYKVPFTVILGQKELLDGTVIIRDMENGIQEVVDMAKVEEELKKRLKK